MGLLVTLIKRFFTEAYRETGLAAAILATLIVAPCNCM